MQTQEEFQDVAPAPFPARTTTTRGTIGGVPTDVMNVAFSDKTVITVSQRGRLAHWVHVDLPPSLFSGARSAPTSLDNEETLPSSDLLPMAHLTATTVLGGTIPERETTGQLIATQVASIVASKTRQTGRLLVFGLGLEKATLDSVEYKDLIDLIITTF